MTDIHARAFVRRGNTLRPSDFASDELLASIKEGSQVLITVRRPRSIQHHRLLFATLRKVVENTDRWADETVLLEDLKLATGLFTTRISAITGMPYPVPASISFSAMPQDRFNAWFEKAIEVLAKDVLSVAPEALRAEVEAMIAGDCRRAA